MRNLKISIFPDWQIFSFLLKKLKGSLPLTSMTLRRLEEYSIAIDKASRELKDSLWWDCVELPKEGILEAGWIFPGIDWGVNGFITSTRVQSSSEVRPITGQQDMRIRLFNPSKRDGWQKVADVWRTAMRDQCWKDDKGDFDFKRLLRSNGPSKQDIAVYSSIQ